MAHFFLNLRLVPVNTEIKLPPHLKHLMFKQNFTEYRIFVTAQEYCAMMEKITSEFGNDTLYHVIGYSLQYNFLFCLDGSWFYTPSIK